MGAPDVSTAIYLIEKSRHKDSLRRIKAQQDRMHGQACVVLEAAAMNFMRHNPSITAMYVHEGSVAFYEGDTRVQWWMDKPYCTKRVADRVKAFERDFTDTFEDMFGKTMRSFRIDRTATGKLRTRRIW